MTQPSPALFDTGNPLIAPAPARLDTGMINSPAGPLGVVTIRTATTTLTVLLGADDVVTWAQVLKGLSGALGSSIVPATASDITVLNGMKKRQPGTLYHLRP